MRNNRWTAKRFISTLTMLMVLAAPLSFRNVSAGPVMGKDVNLSAQENLLDAPTNQVIVKYRSNANLKAGLAPEGNERLQILRSAAGIDLQYYRPLSDSAHVLQLPERLPLETVERIASRLMALPDVEYAEPDYLMFPALVPNDPHYGIQWHYFETYGVNLPAAWDITVGSDSLRIAVLDTGITDHVDLVGRWTGGYDFITDVLTANDGNGRDNDPHDPGNWVTFHESQSGPFTGYSVTNSTWHGTHVAGTIGAGSNNSDGVVGVNWVSQIVPIRVLGKCGGFTSDVADRIRWAAGLAVSGVPANTQAARVLNLSLAGIGACSATYQNALDDVNAIGAIVVVSAGNNSANLNTTTIQPANCNGVITVAATDRGGDKTLTSNYGATIEISAPGGETIPTLQNGVFSTLNTGLTTPGTSTYGYYSGTSMAAPHVSGVISLMLSLAPNLDSAQILQLLQNSASAFPPGSGCTTATCGSGIVNAGSALDALGIPPPTSTATQAPSFTPTMATATPSQTPSNTPAFTSTPSRTPSNTPTFTPLPTASQTASHTATFTFTPSRTPTTAPSLTPSNTATFTPSATPSQTPSNTVTSTFTPSRTPTTVPSLTPSNTATFTSLPTASQAPSNTATVSFTLTSTPSRTPSNTNTFTASATASQTPSQTPSVTFTPSQASTVTPLDTLTVTASLTPSPTSTVTVSPTPLWTPTRTPTASSTLSHTLTASVTPSQTPRSSPTVTVPTQTQTANPTKYPLPTNPALSSRAISPASLTIQYGSATGSLPSLGLIEQNGVDDDPSAYIRFETPGSRFVGYQSFYLPANVRPTNVHLSLLQVNFKGPAFLEQVWTWSIYDWKHQRWIKLGSNFGTPVGEWDHLIFRIPSLSRFISPSREIRIELRSSNSAGDAKIDYAALHITYRSSVPAPTSALPPNLPRGRPYVFPATYTPPDSITPISP